MKPTNLAGTALLLVAATAAIGAMAETSRSAVAADRAAAAPSHRVLACYFHRTRRCPTCKRISAYVEESIKAGFADELKSGQVAMYMIDFQDPENQRYTDYYKITGPTLVIIDVHENRLAAWKPAPKVWSLVGKKEQFLKYVQDEVRGYLEDR